MTTMTDTEYREKCSVVAREATAAGLTVYGLLDPGTGWKPGVMLDHSFMDRRVEEFARERGYSNAPSNTPRHLAIIETREER